MGENGFPRKILSNSGADIDAAECRNVSLKIINSLRQKLDISYEDCITAADSVIEDLVENLPRSLQVSALKNIQSELLCSQETMTRTEARKSSDFSVFVAMIENLEQYRSSSDNYERMWQGGQYSSESLDLQRDSPQKVVSWMNKNCNLINPGVLLELIQYPGDGHPDEFKLLTVLGDELHWLLQDQDSSRIDTQMECLNDLAEIFLHSISIHPEAAGISAANENLRGSLFRVLNKIIKCGAPDCLYSLGRSRLSQILCRWMKLATHVISLLTADTDFRTDFPNQDMVVDLFPECNEFFTGLIEKFRRESSSMTLDRKEQIIALIVAFGSLCQNGETDDGRELCFFLNHFLGSSALVDDDILEFLVYRLISWWNHHGEGSSIDGTDISKDVGLQNAVKLVPQFLSELLCIKISAVRKDDLTVGILFSESEVDHSCDEVLEGEKFYLVRHGDLTVIVEVNERILQDCDPTEPIYQEAVVMKQHITQHSR